MPSPFPIRHGRAPGSGFAGPGTGCVPAIPPLFVMPGLDPGIHSVTYQLNWR